jgi:hypothetical protein
MFARLRARLAAATVIALGLSVAAQVPAAHAVAPTVAPELALPLDSATVGSNPVFSWAAVPAADKYRIQVSKTDTFATVVYDVTTTNRSATPITQLETTTLYWHVAALTGAEGGAYSATRTLIRDWSDAPALASPASGAVLEYPATPPLLSWQPLAGAAS